MNDTLRGQLNEGALANLMQFLALNQASGCLVLRHPQGAQGHLFFEGGKPTHIKLGSQQDVEALASLLGWQEGQFVFRAEARAPERSLKMTLNTLLLEAAYQADTRRSRHRLFDEATILVAKALSEGDQNVALTSRALQLSRHLDGVQPLGEAAARAGLSLADAFQAAEELFHQGLAQPLSSRLASPDFLRELTRLVVNIMGPMGEIVVEDALYDLGSTPETFPVSSVGDLLRELKTQFRRADWQQAFARQSKELAQRYGLA